MDEMGFYDLTWEAGTLGSLRKCVLSPKDCVL